MKTNTRTLARPAEGARLLLAMAREGERQLAAELDVVNGLNVFPVPDGDTGSNMLATVRAAIEQAADASPLPALARALANGAMLGARGNSGVILSQVFRAVADTLDAQPELTPGSLRTIMQAAGQLARDTVSNPVEGTMLSILSACAQADAQPTLDRQLEAAVSAAYAAVARTPRQLPILEEAQVVDSGGYGLLVLLRGFFWALSGKQAQEPLDELLGVSRVRHEVASGAWHPSALTGQRAEAYGYCVTVLIDQPRAGEAEVRGHVSTLGDSVLVAQAHGQMKVHVHVPDPDPVLAYARAIGRLAGSEVTNIDEQVGGEVATLPVVAVAPGQGLAQVMRSLGARVVVGGPAHNPSTAELLAACDEVLAQHGSVFLLPNNDNVAAAARQAARQRAAALVVPARSVPQGVAALLAYDAGASTEDNLAAMTAAGGRVLDAEVVGAVHAASIEGITVRPGESMVLAGGKLLGTGEAGLERLVEQVQNRAAELATVYYGASVTQAEAETLRDRLVRRLPGLQVEIVRGDQPHAQFLLSFE